LRRRGEAQGWGRDGLGAGEGVGKGDGMGPGLLLGATVAGSQRRQRCKCAVYTAMPHHIALRCHSPRAPRRPTYGTNFSRSTPPPTAVNHQPQRTAPLLGRM
jgi:hypothetical protein